MSASVGAGARAGGKRGYNAGRRPSSLRPLRELRIDHGLSLRALAAAAGIDRAIISQIERGRMVATIEEAAKLSTALGLEANQLRPVTLLATEVHAWKETDASP